MALMRSRACPPSRLEIYVASTCIASATARGLAGIVAGWEIPDLEVRVVDLDEPGAVRPRSVFAVPTYLLDGALLSLGNPSVDEIRAQLDRRGVGDRCP